MEGSDVWTVADWSEDPAHPDGWHRRFAFIYVADDLCAEEDFNPDDYDDADDPETLEEEERLEMHERVDHQTEIAELEAVGCFIGALICCQHFCVV